MKRRDRKKQQKRNARQENPQSGRVAKPAPETSAQGIAATEPAPLVDDVHNAEQAHDRPAIDDFFRFHDGAAWLNNLLLAEPGSNHLQQPLWNAEIPGHLMLNCKTCCEILVAAEVIAAAIAANWFLITFPRNKVVAELAGNGLRHGY